MFFSHPFRPIAAFVSIVFLLSTVLAQKSEQKPPDQRVRTVTIPISIFTKAELKKKESTEFVEAGDLTVKEDNEEQVILSIRSVTSTPLHLAVLIQDDLTSSINLQLEEIKKFIRTLPPDSRVMVGYLRPGSVQVRQRFTTDLEKAAAAIRIVIGSSAGAPRNPYDGVEETLARFDALPTGRRAILLVSDGVDASEGLNTVPGQSLELDRAILKAQRRSVAVYSFYNAATLTASGNSRLVLAGQGSLNKLSEETGGKAFFAGTSSPISFDPFFRDLNLMLKRQFALTYLSTHMKKGYHKIQVLSTNPEVRIEHPKGYFYR